MASGGSLPTVSGELVVLHCMKGVGPLPLPGSPSGLGDRPPFPADHPRPPAPCPAQKDTSGEWEITLGPPTPYGSARISGGTTR